MIAEEPQEHFRLDRLHLPAGRIERQPVDAGQEAAIAPLVSSEW